MVEIEEQCAALLRQLRRKKGLTLRECEIASEGRFKAVVMGSYERGTRAISLSRLQELADFYHVPIQYFFGSDQQTSTKQDKAYTFDLRKLKISTHLDLSFERIAALLNHFIQQRGDWNGEVLSIRTSDGAILEAFTNDKEIIHKLDFYGLSLEPKN